MCFGGWGTFVGVSSYIVWWRNGCSVDNRVNVEHAFEGSFLFFPQLHSVVCFGSFG